MASLEPGMGMFSKKRTPENKKEIFIEFAIQILNIKIKLIGCLIEFKTLLKSVIQTPIVVTKNVF